MEIEELDKIVDGKKLFTKVFQRVFPGDRILITGSNGSGKTTLLKCILGDLPIDGGKVCKAVNVKIGYLDQEAYLCEKQGRSVSEYFQNRFSMTEEDLRRELHKAGFGAEEFLKSSLENLSIGQRKRLIVLTLILEKTNVLFLDEPTNHLDFVTLEALEKALLTYQGALIVVSHDKRFIEKIGKAWTQKWELSSNY